MEQRAAAVVAVAEQAATGPGEAHVAGQTGQGLTAAGAGRTGLRRLHVLAVAHSLWATFGQSYALCQ